MLFTKKTVKALPPIVYKDNIIKKVTQHELLGTTIDDSPTFKSQISILCINISRGVSLLSKGSYAQKCAQNSLQC